MARTISLGRTLVLAGVAHAVLILLAGGRRAALAKEEVHEEPLKLVWIEPTPQGPVSPPEPPPDPVAEPRVAETERARALSPSSASVRETVVSPGAPVGSAIVLPESAPSTPDGWTLHVTSGRAAGDPRAGKLAALGLDGKNHFMGKRVTDEDAEHAALERGNREAGEAMRTALHDHDVALGLGGGGPVVKALEELVSVSLAPNESHAVLVAVTDASGTVTSIHVESASGDPAPFHAIAAELLERLKTQKMRVPEGSRGLAVRVDVASSVAPPSGGGPGLDLAKTGGHFDVSDIGAHPRRVVHARILAEQIL